MRPAPRSQRKADALALLRTEVDCWVASADEIGNAYLVPLSHYWDGAALVLTTPRSVPSGSTPDQTGTNRSWLDRARSRRRRSRGGPA